MYLNVLVSALVPRFWWFDPVGATIISFLIIYTWIKNSLGYIKKLVGKTATPSFLVNY